MKIDINLVKQLREETGISIIECRNALEETNGDIAKAKEILRKKGFDKAKSKSTRVTEQGAIDCYIHHNRKIGVMVELACETDFVAKNEDFIALAHDLALQIAASNPRYISEKDIPAEVIEKEKEIYRDQLKDTKKPAEVIEKIVEGRLQKFYAEVCLLKQPFFKDEKSTVEEIIAQKIHKIGENIVVKRFIRFQVGVEN